MIMKKYFLLGLLFLSSFYYYGTISAAETEYLAGINTTLINDAIKQYINTGNLNYNNNGNSITVKEITETILNGGMLSNSIMCISKIKIHVSTSQTLLDILLAR